MSGKTSSYSVPLALHVLTRRRFGVFSETSSGDMKFFVSGGRAQRLVRRCRVEMVRALHHWPIYALHVRIHVAAHFPVRLMGNGAAEILAYCCQMSATGGGVDTPGLAPCQFVFSELGAICNEEPSISTDVRSTSECEMVACNLSAEAVNGQRGPLRPLGPVVLHHVPQTSPFQNSNVAECSRVGGLDEHDLERGFVVVSVQHASKSKLPSRC